ncbi:MAG: class I SAM-dependent methyltransferase [Patescibacteria group bacterium]
MIDLICPKCKISLKKENDSFVCGSCQFILKNNNCVLVDNGNEAGKDFYDKIYSDDKGAHWLKGLERNFFKSILELISLSYRRERFFKRNMQSGKDNMVLDIACGAGRDYFRKFGYVVGVDLSLKPLDIAKRKYDLIIQGGAENLPFADNTFDYVVSSDFFGHIKNEDKDAIIKEVLRVLKPGGKTLHVIETDSENFWFKIAHKNPDLFQKYFIEKIGGHIGLEMPDKVVKRWMNNGFEILKVKKIWGVVWPIQDYQMFDNEYENLLRSAKTFVIISKILSKVKLVQVGVNILLNPLNSIIESLTPINKGQGLMLICQKK